MTISVKHNLPWSSIAARPMKVWVLAPLVATNDEHIDYYYDFSQSIEEYTRVFETLQLDWKWQPVTINNFTEQIRLIEEEKNCGPFFPLVLNLCDGDEVNGSPGVSVIAALEKSGLIYTGADDAFYRITTSKIPMKEAFDLHGVATAAWQIMKESNNYDYLFDTIGSPLIVKPAVSGGSMGVGIKNVVDNDKQVADLIESLQTGYRGWNLLADGLIAEAFINGPEYTSLVTGHYLDPDNIHVYEPVERVFHNSLPEKEQFLSFERLWEIYENESAMPDNENFYEYQRANKAVAAEIKRLTKAAFIATRGVGYARADIRGDKNNGQLYMLEINAQCGISEDENFTSIGAILRFEQIGFHQLILEILQEALNRHQHLLLAEQHRIFTSNT